MIVLANIEAKSGIQTSVDYLQQGHGAVDAMVEGISLVEEDPNVRSVGYGGWPNLIGEMEFDAGVMDGDTLEIGSVGAVKEILHCSKLAREVMRKLPHNMLVGEGANRFASETGFKSPKMLVDDSQKVWADKIREVLCENDHERFPHIPLAPMTKLITDPERVRDTTVFLGQDKNGSIGVATSTSGWAWKYPGRLGDSPIAGAGFYANSKYGAAACTHTGEMTMRTCTAFAVVDGLRRGLSLQDAVVEAAQQLLELKEGYLGEVVIHAIDKTGNHLVANLPGPEPIAYWVWEPSMAQPEMRQSTIVT